MAQIVAKSPRLDPPIVLEEGWTVIGYKNGWPIVEAELPISEVPPDHRPEGWKTPVVDDEGKNVFRKDRKGNDLGQRHKLMRGKVKVSFWLCKSPRGFVRKQFDYKDNPADVVKRENRKKVAEFSQGLAERAVAAGLSVDEVFARLVSQAEAAPEAPSLPAVKDLPAVLAQVTSEQAVYEMWGKDDRTTAAKHYEARIAELAEEAA